MSEASKLERLLAQGHDYLWALRHVHLSGSDAQEKLSAAGIDSDALEVLRQLDRAVVRNPHPTKAAAAHEYLELPLPSGATTYISPMLTEAGVEMGTELFPMRTEWVFAHHELQFCTGGRTLVHCTLPNGIRESKTLRTGDIMLIPEGAHLVYESSEDDGYGHAHIYGMVLDAPYRTYYSALATAILRDRGVIDGEGMPSIRVDDRIEVKDWAQIVSPREGRAEQEPTWLRMGWENRAIARAVDRNDGALSLVINSPDREPDDYLQWGDGPGACLVNPVISEYSSAVTDCVFPAGWFACLPYTELWIALRGSAQLSMTLAPLHNEEVELSISSGDGVVIPAACRVTVLDADEDLVVRRQAGSCGYNGHWAMMEAKLEADGQA